MCESFGKPLTCEIRVEAVVDGHLVNGWPSQNRERGDYKRPMSAFDACGTIFEGSNVHGGISNGRLECNLLGISKK